MKNTIIKGSVILLIASAISKILGAIYRIPLSNILGASGMGVYQLIFPAFSLALIISSGVCATVAHFVAKIHSTGQGSEKQVFFQGMLFSLISSLFFAIVFLVFSKQIATLQGNIDASFGYQISAIALVFASLLAPFRGLYQGRLNMLPTAISQILEQGVKLVLGLLFCVWFSKYSLALAVGGAFLGIGISEIVAFLFLLFKTFRKTFFENTTNEKNKFFSTNFAITFSSLVLPILTVVDSFLVVNILKQCMAENIATSLYGLQSGIVTSLINFPVVVSVAISLNLLPNLSADLSSGDTQNAIKKIENVIKFLLFFLIPFFLVFLFFSKEILTILYPTLNLNLLEIGEKLLQISAINVIFISIVQIVVSAFQSMGKTLVPVFVMGVFAIIKIFMEVILISNTNVGIFGLAQCNVLFFGGCAFILGILIKKYLPIIFFNKKFVLTLTLSSILTCLGFLAINVYFSSILAKILCAMSVGAICYLLPIVFFDAFELKNLIKMESLK